MAQQTAKEKAQELFSDYRYILSIPNAPLGELKDDIAKSCALKAVDEVMNIVKYYETKRGRLLIDNIRLLYWVEVKNEITKL